MTPTPINSGNFSSSKLVATYAYTDIMQFAVNVLSRIKTDSESVVSQLTDMFNVRQKNQS